jgi:hypothetical protein
MTRKGDAEPTSRKSDHARPGASLTTAASSIDHFVMAITAAEAVVRDTVPYVLRVPQPTQKGRLVVMAMITSALRDTALESRARREAKRVDLVATKSRGRKHTTDDHGGFQLVDPRRHAVVIGSKYNLSAKDVIEFCTKHVGND